MPVAPQHTLVNLYKTCDLRVSGMKSFGLNIIIAQLKHSYGLNGEKISSIFICLHEYFAGNRWNFYSSTVWDG